MPDNSRVYITTTLPYVNAEPHLGFALELVQADTLARSWRLSGKEVFLNTGTDEHGLKIYLKSAEEGRSPQKLSDDYSAKFKALIPLLHISPDIHFVRTTEARHLSAAREFWRRCQQSGDIYKKEYEGKYCVGCELEKTDSELALGRCPIHPTLEIEIIKEENYFFRFSKYQKKLTELYEAKKDFVVPDSRFNEIKAFVERGIKDFSVSRPKEKVRWGVEVPGDSGHNMYVWFDALVSYLTALGWPEGEEFERFWPAIQFAGKDNLRQQSAMWQAMLMSAGLPPSKQIFIHGFILSAGQKMSKTAGNVLRPEEVVERFGAEAVRYYLLRHVHPFEDSDVTTEKIKEAYNANLANGLGNLTARILQMSSAYLEKVPEISKDFGSASDKGILNLIGDYKFNQAMDALWRRMKDLDTFIQEGKTFEIVKKNKIRGEKQLVYLLTNLYEIAVLLEPFMPETSQKIKAAVAANKKPAALFPRKE
ncbi:MAG: methionine--tRNA ligase [Candidatus Taylorbacteria bacterium]|nr:methionine--tRNA ligase [Candidatus Taylorbacteria bacterium]